MIKNFEINGSNPFSVQVVENYINDGIARIESSMNRFLSMNNNFRTQQQNVAEIGTQNQGHSGTSEAFQLYTWGDKIGRIVPDDFEFPSVDVHKLWNLWYFGNLEKKIYPYYKFDKYRDDFNEIQSSQISRAKRVMELMVKYLIQNEKITTTMEITKKTQTESDELFNFAFQALLAKCYPDGKTVRPHENNFLTFAHKVYKLKLTSLS